MTVIPASQAKQVVRETLEKQEEIARLWECLHHEGFPENIRATLFEIMLLLKGEPLPDYMYREIIAEIKKSTRTKDREWLQKFFPDPNTQEIEGCAPAM